MKKQIRFLTLVAVALLSALAQAQYSTPDIWVNTGEFSDMRAGNALGSVHIQSGEGFSTSLFTGYLADGVNTPLSTLNSASQCHSGNWCYSGNFASAGSHWINAAYTAPGQTAMSTATHQFFRMYVKFPVNATMGPPGCLGKIMYLRNSTAPSQTLQFDLQGRSGGSGMNVYFEYGSDSALSPSAVIPFDGQWHYLETELNTTTSSPHQRAWIDDPNTPAIDWAYQFQAANNWYPNFEITFGPYINPSGNNGCTSFSNATVFVDDMAESTSRIGPTSGGGGGGGGTPASVPSSYFGMHTLNPTAHWPTVPIGAMRPANVSWGAVETARGVYNWTTLDSWVNAAQSHGVELDYLFLNTPSWAGPASTLPPTNLQDWNDFVTALVTRYRGKIKSYELWNEPNSTGYWTGTIAQLVDMSHRAYTIIRAIDPAAKVLTPSPTWTATTAYAWMDSYLTAGGGAYADVIAYHAYTGNPPNGESVLTVINGMNTVLASHGFTGESWITEAGWGLDSDLPSASDQTGFLAQRYLLSWGAGVQRFYWYQWDNTLWGTLWTSGGGVNQAGNAYQQVYNWMVGATASACTVSSNTYTCAMTRTGGYEARAVWNRVSPAAVSYPSQFTRYRDLTGTPHALTVGGTVTAGSLPILLETVAAPADTTAPTVSLTAPAAGNVSGTVTVTATCTDDVACVGVKFYYNRQESGLQQIASEVTGAGPYSVSLNTRAIPNGGYTLTAVGRDAAGHSTTSSGVSVTNISGPDTWTAHLRLYTLAPAGSVVINHIDDASSWGFCGNCAGGVTTTDFDMAGGQVTPSLDGSSRKFRLGGVANDAALWWHYVNSSPGQYSWATHFLWDFWVRVDSLAHVHTLEFDAFQRAADGYWYMIGSHCNFGDGHWFGWNQVTNSWIATSVPCNSTLMPAGTWNHVVWMVERIPGTHNYKYDWLQVNGTTYTLNLIEPAAPNNFSQITGVQWQIDRNGSTGDINEWIDKATLTIW